jgi:hypothetical protein
MSAPGDIEARTVSRWTAWYTAGLPGSVGTERRAEIASDAAEHRRARLDDGWDDRRIARERLWRTARGAPADLAWRFEVLAAGSRMHPAVRDVVLVVASVASLAVAAFHGLFAAYLLGADQLAERPMLSGLKSYAEEVGSAGAAAAAGVILALGAVILVCCLVRPVAPLTANLAIITIAMWSVLWFWLGVAPLGIVAVGGTIADMVMRAPAFRRPA